MQGEAELETRVKVKLEGNPMENEHSGNQRWWL